MTLLRRRRRPDVMCHLSEQNRKKKNSPKECVFVNSALKLKIQCHVVKNTLIQTALSAILPTGVLPNI